MHVTVSSARNKDTCLNFCFDEVDKDKNGSVTLEELKLKMQPAVSRHEIKHFVQVYFFKSQLSLLQDLLKTLACAEVTWSPSLFPVVLTRYCHGCSGNNSSEKLPHLDSFKCVMHSCDGWLSESLKENPFP